MLSDEDIKIILNCLHGENEMMILVKIRNRVIGLNKIALNQRENILGNIYLYSSV